MVLMYRVYTKKALHILNKFAQLTLERAPKTAQQQKKESKIY